ncbi:hypothetical protein B0H14DRAFT_2578353 [Mycena olivaceomarginata]|nr:hypothetical protein B0H14DRAFT_2578353 [Mycena olivaceomarginata]
MELRLGLGALWIEKKNGPPSRVAVVEQENIETVHAPKHIQAAGALCMDRVAVLWSVPTAHRPREVKGPVPSRRTDQQRAFDEHSRVSSRGFVHPAAQHFESPSLGVSRKA